VEIKEGKPVNRRKLKRTTASGINEWKRADMSEKRWSRVKTGGDERRRGNWSGRSNEVKIGEDEWTGKKKLKKLRKDELERRRCIKTGEIEWRSKMREIE
jgi:hypothetical protein